LETFMWRSFIDLALTFAIINDISQPSMAVLQLPLW
jgi:hypothetical protein